LQEISKKTDVWKKRAEIDSYWEDAVKVLELDVADELALILKTTQPISTVDKSITWSKIYWDISKDEPYPFAGYILSLNKQADKIKAICKLFSFICDVISKPDQLGFDSLENFMIDNKKEFANNCKTIGLTDTGDGEQFEVETDGDVPIRISLLNLNKTHPFLLKYLMKEVSAIRNDLTLAFKPNISEIKMPPPFIISFDQKYLINHETNEVYGSHAGDFGISLPDSVTIAIPCVALPFAISIQRLSYVEDAYRKTVRDFAINSIHAAKANDANIVLFPEYFLPRERYLDEIMKCAEREGIYLIGGTEGLFSQDKGAFLNEAVILLSGCANPYYQKKHKRSSEEPQLYTDNKVLFFTSTSIGNFCVIMCSDYRELDVLDAVRRIAPKLDFIFVLANNKHPDLFVKFAQADADRFYTNIIICNQFPPKTDTTKSVYLSKEKFYGSYWCSPYVDDIKVSHTINLKPIQGAVDNPFLTLVEMDLTGIFRGTGVEKPADHWHLAPQCRRC
jgi:hypothetical protein